MNNIKHIILLDPSYEKGCNDAKQLLKAYGESGLDLVKGITPLTLYEKGLHEEAKRILNKSQVRGFMRTRRGRLERVGPYSKKGEKKEYIYKDKDFLDPEYEHMQSRSVAVVEYHINPGSEGGRYEPPERPSVEDVTYAWASGPKKGKELTIGEVRGYIEKEGYASKFEDEIMQHAEDQAEAQRDWSDEHRLLRY
jgi:hypothetical protein